jgi:tetratricopeptide (TPR) repeat protein
MKELPSVSITHQSKLSLEYRIFAAIFFLFFLLLTPLGLFNDWIPPLTQKGFYSITTIDQGDDTGYYSFIRSAFFDKDFDFFNERNYAHSQKIMPTGYVFNNWQIGQAVLYFPFFLVGHAVAQILNGMGIPASLDGYSFPYYMSTALAAHVYMFAGLLILFNLLQNHYSRVVSFISTLGIWLGSSLIYYTFIRQRMAHVPEFFSATLFLAVWVKDRKSNFSNPPILAGILLAFLSTIRLTNIAYIFIYLIDWFLFRYKIKNLENEKFENINFFLAFSGAFLLGFLPQLFVWQKINGVPFPKHITGMASNSIDGLNFQKYINRFVDIFVGADWGIIYSMPLILLAVYGLFFLKSIISDSKPGIAIFFAFLVAISIIFPAPDAYGERYLFPAIPLLAFGLANVFTKCWSSIVLRNTCLFFTFACVIAQYLMLVQYKTSLKYDNPKFSLIALAEIPSLLFQRTEELLRSTNLVKLLTLKNVTPYGNNVDFIFVFLFPLIQVALIWGVIRAFQSLKDQPLSEIKTKKLVGTSILGVVTLLILIQTLTPSKPYEEIEKRLRYADFMKKGDSAVQAENKELALNLFTKAQQLFPDQLRPYFEIGRFLLIEEQLEKAETNFRNILKRHPVHPGTLFYLGNIMMAKGDFSQAEDFALKAIRINPENSLFFDFLGRIYFKTNRYDRAETNYKNAILLKPDSWQAHGNLGILYYFAKKLKLAKFYLQKSIEYGNLNSSVFELAKLLKNKS